MRLTSKMPVHESTHRRAPRAPRVSPSRVRPGRGVRRKGRITRPRREH
jgi:hypothetical protein